MSLSFSARPAEEIIEAENITASKHEIPFLFNLITLPSINNNGKFLRLFSPNQSNAGGAARFRARSLHPYAEIVLGANGQSKTQAGSERITSELTC